MSDPFSNIPELFLGFLLLSALYIIPVAVLFFLMKIASSISPSPYTIKNLATICIPGFFYAFLEIAWPRQDLNFILVILALATSGILATIFIKKINSIAFAGIACLFALALWLMVPEASLKLF